LFTCPNVISEYNIPTFEFKVASKELNINSLPLELTSKILLSSSSALKLKFVELIDSSIE